MSGAKRFSWILLACGFAVIACDRDKDSAAQNTTVSASAPVLQPLNFPPDDGPLPSIDGDRAMQYVIEAAETARPLDRHQVGGPFDYANHVALSLGILADAAARSVGEREAL